VETPNILKSNSTIGIFGGGQLGQMICNAAKKLGFKTVVFSDVANCPASLVCDQIIVADYLDEKALSEFASKIDIATFEFENIPTSSVDFVAKTRPTFPNSNVLRITQNRLNEKDFINQIGIKTTEYQAISSLQDLQTTLEKFNYKAVLKTTTMGYDGKGQKVLTEESNLEEVWKEFSKETNNQDRHSFPSAGFERQKNSEQLFLAKSGCASEAEHRARGKLLPSGESGCASEAEHRARGELILEKFADFEQEISVIVARSINGEIACYQPLTNIHKNGILDQSIYPAKINKQTADNAVAIATKIVEKLDLIGLLAVEFFVLENGEENNNLLVNELAPRPHNSGHFSMDACNTSQFEQLIRAISAMPLGNVNFHSHGYMQNLIGEDVLEVNQHSNNKKARIHIYGKDKIAKGRKMGHINFLEN
jgi:5-(carboxyamino)imidazole ribonucleotide synthase